MNVKAASGDITRVRTGAVIICHYEGMKTPDNAAAAVDKALDGTISNLIKQGDIKGKTNEVTLLHTFGKLPAGRVLVVGLGKKKDLDVNKVRDAAATACRYLRGKGVTDIASALLGVGINKIKSKDAALAITEGALLGLYTFRRHITRKKDEPKEIKELTIVGDDKKTISGAIEKGRITAEAANWARDIINEPGNFMTPTLLAEAARKLSGEYGLDVEVLDREKIAELGMGGLLGVSQGSRQPPTFTIIRYKGKPTDEIDIALVGKGITFDSGGISIKPSDHMADMKGDMAGGAAVMAVLIAVVRLKPDINVIALVPATENMPGGSAMKPGDIITAMNGETIEVLNTDAEGRLILADALSYAKKLGAKAIVDVATLTGACQVALGNNCTGAFTNNQRLADKLFAAGKEAGEPAWQLPMFDEYKEQLKSDVADIKNIGTRYGGAITAAKFLEDFVDGTPWVHLDIAGTADGDKEKGALVKGATGVPVRTLVNLILKMAK